MTETPAPPWLSIIGIGEDGLDGLSAAARDALDRAELVIGATRHLGLLPPLKGDSRAWPVPFDAGIAPLLAERGRRVVLLASGDPFWFGAGSSVTRYLDRDEWIAHPAPSTFGLAASRLGWSLEDTVCLGLHAAPLSRLRPHLALGRRVLVLVRDGAAVADLAHYLVEQGFGASTLTVLEALGGPRERVRSGTAEGLQHTNITNLVTVGIECAGEGAILQLASGRPDEWFQHDGQISKRPVRALTLSALAPRPGERLWDIGTGSGSIAIEWLLAHPAMQATGFEADAARAARARDNARALGADRLAVVEGRAPDALAGQALPDAVFIGGGLNDALLETLWAVLRPGTRLVANAVTLESEAVLAQWHGDKGGSLLRIDLAEAAPLGTRRGWKAHYPLVQWSVTL
ncbi:precorrin-6y C5,15-methyltransferase (decarboxylating) subunit CbiE [Sphingobium sufflavum]|uniref:precorrin-6y C5,15-methyltransferase (decarboxylating) subunit CbiE n=1 Tax=Sphingobium sufflavum TaxID=1129547 RepID=UPI001F3C1EC9|nr:precorrin-6y C5,15-methyltransferase (decarboxylating) subunit CbiE [Sphingobium sufflavum]MCE7797116.1 precorrin-6y C5,15-methyltransferase (decarboxylating) subunit CbiE [Sphingobium sufflavum]